MVCLCARLGRGRAYTLQVCTASGRALEKHLYIYERRLLDRGTSDEGRAVRRAKL